ncbi:MAG: M28 family peptidase [Polyangiales bacterium]
MRLTHHGLALIAAGCALAAASCDEREVEPASTLEARADDEVWITTGRDTLPSLARLHGITPTVYGPARDGAPVAVRLPRRLLPSLSEIAHDEHHRCGGYVLHDDEADAMEAAEGPIAIEKQTVAGAYRLDNPETVQALSGALREAELLTTVRKLSSYPTRHHASATGLEAARWLRDTWAGFAKGRTDVKVALVTHTRTPQPSVSLTIRGGKLPNEHVILGGHLDSIAGRNAAAKAPGADDNASGIGTLTEVARAALSLGYVPERTVTFYAYAGEEVGLLGSADIATQAKQAALKVVGVMQLDMTNFNAAREPYIALIRDNTDVALNQFTAQLIDTYVLVPWKFDRCGYACSDHASWTARGFPAAFPHEAALAEGNKRIHTADDTLARSSDGVGHAMKFARLGAAFVGELAKGKVAAPTHRPAPPVPATAP